MTLANYLTHAPLFLDVCSLLCQQPLIELGVVVSFCPRVMLGIGIDRQLWRTAVFRQGVDHFLRTLHGHSHVLGWADDFPEDWGAWVELGLRNCCAPS